MTFEITVKSPAEALEVLNFCKDNEVLVETLDKNTINVYVDDNFADELEDFFEKFNLTRRLI